MSLEALLCPPKLSLFDFALFFLNVPLQTTNSTPGWQMIRALWKIAGLNWPGQCFYPSNNAMESIALRYVSPGTVLVVLIGWHVFATFW